MRSANRFDLADIGILAIHPPETGETLLHDTVATGLALRLRASGARTWVLFGRTGGQTTRQTLGDAQSITLAAARRMAGVKVTGSPKSDETPTAAAPLFKSNATIADLFAGFLAHGQKGRWKPQTSVRVESIGRLHIIPLLGDRKVSALTPEETARWYQTITTRGKGARNYLSVLSQMMLYAEDHGLRPAGSNPCKGLRKKQNVRHGSHLPNATIKRLWDALDRLHSEMPAVCDIVRLLLLTGARKSEIIGLRWDQIIGPRAVLADSKTGPRTIWLNADARAILEARREKATGAWVFPAVTDDGPMPTMDRGWKRILSEARIDALRVHDLRHHFASVAVSNSIDLRLIGQLLGHADIESTLCYAHLATGALAQSASRVSGVIDRSTGIAHLPAALPKQRPSRVRPRVTGRTAVSHQIGEAQHA